MPTLQKLYHITSIPLNFKEFEEAEQAIQNKNRNMSKSALNLFKTIYLSYLPEGCACIYPKSTIMDGTRIVYNDGRITQQRIEDDLSMLHKKRLIELVETSFDQIIFPTAKGLSYISDMDKKDLDFTIYSYKMFFKKKIDGVHPITSIELKENTEAKTEDEKILRPPLYSEVFETIQHRYVIEGHPCVHTQSNLLEEMRMIYELAGEPADAIINDLKNLEKQELIELVQAPEETYIFPTIKGMNGMKVECPYGDVQKSLQRFKKAFCEERIEPEFI